MKDEDLKITALDGGFSVEVSGRANFDYAVPLRALSAKLTPGTWLQIDMENCEAMDSTFMGVLTMLALKMRKSNVQITVINAGEHLIKLLRDLGVAKFFKFVSGGTQIDTSNSTRLDNTGHSGLLATAETVAEAHKALVGADESNAVRFGKVIEFAEEDVARLRKENQ